MSTVVTIVLVIVAIIVIVNILEAKVGTSTDNTGKINDFYFLNPHYMEPFLQAASGNEESLRILERIGVLSSGGSEDIDISRFLHSDMSGYKLTLFFNAANKNIMKLAVASTNRIYFAKLQNRIVRQEYYSLPDYNKVNLQNALNKYKIDNKYNLLSVANVVAWKSCLNWKLLKLEVA